MARLQAEPDTALQEGDVINLDDTHSAHPYAKKLPFLSWLFDSSTKTYNWCMKEHSFDWVTKAKRNTALYRKVMAFGGRERYVPVTPKQLIRDVYKRLLRTGSRLAAVAISDVYIYPIQPWEERDRR